MHNKLIILLFCDFLYTFHNKTHWSISLSETVSPSLIYLLTQNKLYILNITLKQILKSYNEKYLPTPKIKWTNHLPSLLIMFVILAFLSIAGSNTTTNFSLFVSLLTCDNWPACSLVLHLETSWLDVHFSSCSSACFVSGEQASFCPVGLEKFCSSMSMTSTGLRSTSTTRLSWTFS